MPQNLDTGWSFGKLILEVAEDAGLADQTGAVAAIPSDPHALDLVKRAVNKGYQEFTRINPQWSWRNRSFTVATDPTGLGPLCISSDAAVMRLPRWLMKPPTAMFRFADQNSLYGALVPATYQHVRSNQTRFAQTGTPKMGAVRAIDSPDGGVGPGSGTAWALYLWPTPDAVYTFESEGYVYPYDMVELEERHLAGAEHDQTIKAFALKALHSSPHEDADKKAASAAAAGEQLQISLQIDVSARVGSSGLARDPRMRRDIYAPDDHFPGDLNTFTAYGQQIG